MKTAFLFSTILLSTLVNGQNKYRYNTPETRHDGWETADLRLSGNDTARFHRLLSQMHGGDHKVHSILVVRNNKLIVEEYFGNHGIDKQHDLRSTTKSVTSLLMGIALDKGYIADINDPITKYLKNPAAEKNLNGKENITVRHLLTMSTGLDCNDWDKKSKGQEDKVYGKKNMLQYVLDLPMIHDPGTVSNYCTMAQVLAMELIAQASGMSIDSFADQYLFKPLGITNYSWGHTIKKKVIPSARRLYMTPRDMAKLGKLVLQQGLWNGQQIVSASWIRESTAPQTKITGIDYGYLWWNIPLEVGETTYILKAATGNGGQYILILPELNLAAVFTGGAYNSQADKLPFMIVRDVIIPTFTEVK